jgi:hypothetical protein
MDAFLVFVAVLGMFVTVQTALNVMFVIYISSIGKKIESLNNKKK